MKFSRNYNISYHSSENPLLSFLGASFGFFVVIVFLGILFMAFSVGMKTGGMGPSNTVIVTVDGKHVDTSSTGKSSSSHYMVNTDKGVFEVDNGMMLGVWNADEIYGSLKIGKTYSIVTKGEKIVTWYAQEYPYIVSVREVSQPPTNIIINNNNPNAGVEK